MTPGEAKVGIMPADIFRDGNVGVDLAQRHPDLRGRATCITEAGLGVSTCVGIGGDPVIGTTFVDVLELFRDDADTSDRVLIGEIGGSDEEAAAEYIGETVTPSRWSRSSPAARRRPGKRMGHAGAIISGNTGTPQAKVEAFQRAVCPWPTRWTRWFRCSSRRPEVTGLRLPSAQAGTTTLNLAPRSLSSRREGVGVGHVHRWVILGVLCWNDG